MLPKAVYVSRTDREREWWRTERETKTAKLIEGEAKHTERSHGERDSKRAGGDKRVR